MPRQYTPRRTLLCIECRRIVTTYAHRFCSHACYRAYQRRGVGETFWKGLLRTETCWIYQGTIGSHGYGYIRALGISRSAHRFAWESVYGPVPDGLDVLHHCDNPPCVRPSHLHLGTHAQNMREASERGRFPTGERWHRSHDATASKLTPEVVVEIRALYARGDLSYATLARQYNVGKSTIEAAVRRQTWTDVA